MTNIERAVILGDYARAKRRYYALGPASMPSERSKRFNELRYALAVANKTALIFFAEDPWLESFACQCGEDLVVARRSARGATKSYIVFDVSRNRMVGLDTSAAPLSIDESTLTLWGMIRHVG